MADDKTVLSLGDRFAHLALASLTSEAVAAAVDAAEPTAAAAAAAAPETATPAPGVTPLAGDFWDRVMGRRDKKKKQKKGLQSLQAGAEAAGDTLPPAPALVSGDPTVVASALATAAATTTAPLGADKRSAFEEWIDAHDDDDNDVDDDVDDSRERAAADADAMLEAYTRGWLNNDAPSLPAATGALGALGDRSDEHADAWYGADARSDFEKWLDSHDGGAAGAASLGAPTAAAEEPVVGEGESLAGFVGWWKKRQLRKAEKAAAKEEVGAAEAKRRALEENLRLREERKKVEERMRDARKGRAIAPPADAPASLTASTRALAALVASLATGPHDQLLRSDSVPAPANLTVDVYPAQLAVASALVQARLAAASAVTLGGAAGSALAASAVLEGSQRATPAQVAAIHEYARAQDAAVRDSTLDERSHAYAEGGRLYAQLATLVPARTPALNLLVALGVVWQALHMHTTRGPLSASMDRLKQFYTAPVQSTLVDAATLLGRHFA